MWSQSFSACGRNNILMWYIDSMASPRNAVIFSRMPNLRQQEKTRLCLLAIHCEICMNELIAELKVKLIALLDLTDLTPETFDENARLVGGDLGIDSIDLLEMVVMIEKDYRVIINNQEIGEKVFHSLSTLASYIQDHLPREAV